MKALLVLLYLISMVMGVALTNPIGFIAALICLLVYYIIDVFENPEEP